MIPQLLQRALFGSRKFLQQSDLDQMIQCSPFSSFLNYLAYDPEIEIYLNQDSTLGMMRECLPVICAGPKVINAMEGLFRSGIPKGSVIQLIFHADSHIDPILKRYREGRTRENYIFLSGDETSNRTATQVGQGSS